jgi:dihydroneopterin aldolase
MGKIHVKGIRLYAYHGCMAEEAKIGANYLVDVIVHADLLTSSSSDRLSDTADYVHINRIVSSQMGIRAHLLEVVCKRIIDQILAEMPLVKKAKVRVTKLNPPINGNVESVSVVISEERS